MRKQMLRFDQGTVMISALHDVTDATQAFDRSSESYGHGNNNTQGLAEAVVKPPRPPRYTRFYDLAHRRRALQPQPRARDDALRRDGVVERVRDGRYRASLGLRT